jgi:hypothetical protein
MKNSSDTIGNRTRNSPAFSAVPQPTAPPRTPSLHNSLYLIDQINDNHKGRASGTQRERIEMHNRFW